MFCVYFHGFIAVPTVIVYMKYSFKSSYKDDFLAMM
jgi:hypothetical protein